MEINLLSPFPGDRLAFSEVFFYLHMVNRLILLKRQDLSSTIRGVCSKQCFSWASSSDCNTDIANIDHIVTSHMVYALIKICMKLFRRLWFIMVGLPQCQNTNGKKTRIAFFVFRAYQYTDSM